MNSTLTNIYDILKINKEIHLSYCPAHKGIEGNELADAIAKSSTRVKTKKKKPKLSLQEAKKSNKRLVLKPKVPHAIYQFFKHKPEEMKIVTRLKSNKNGLNSFLRTINKHKTGHCNICKVEETAKHYLWNCSKYEQEREEYLNGYMMSDEDDSDLDLWKAKIEYVRATNKEI